MRTSRGLTLVEILVALAITGIALAAAMLAANAQERAYHEGSKVRAAQGAAREALLVLERRLPIAGYGMDATLAFDFQWYDPALVGTCPPEMSPCAADAVGNSDEVTFHARNPAYWVPKDVGAAVTGEPKGHAWSVLALDTGNVQVKAHEGDRFRKGQILQLVCAGTLDYAYFTVAATTPTGPVTVEGTPLDVPLEPVDAANPFRRQDIGVTLGCMTAGAGTPEAKAFQIDRYRFHVRPVVMGDTSYSGKTWTNYTPYLMLDQGIDSDGDGDVDPDDEVFLVEGVESIQLTYIFAEPTIPPAGNVPGTTITLADPASAPSTAPQTIVPTRFPSGVTPLPAGGTEYDQVHFLGHSTLKPPPERLTNAQANIRRILVSVVARSPEPDPTRGGALDWRPGSPAYRQNQNVAPAWITDPVTARGTDNQRTVAESTVALRNMLTRSVSYF